MSIAALLDKQEGKTLEFKRDLSSTENILKTLIAFANTAGGVVLIGVDDKTHKPLEISDPLEAEERLSNLIADSIAPRLVPNVEMTTIEGKTLLLVEVFLSSSRPHWLDIPRAGKGRLRAPGIHQPPGGPAIDRRVAPFRRRGCL